MTESADTPMPPQGVDEVTEGTVPVPGPEPGQSAAPPTPPIIASPPGAPAAVPPAPGAAGPAGASAPGPSAADGLTDDGPAVKASAAVSGVFPPDRPERKVGAAFAGGVLFALVLKRLAR